MTANIQNYYICFKYILIYITPIFQLKFQLKVRLMVFKSVITLFSLPLNFLQ